MFWPEKDEVYNNFSLVQPITYRLIRHDELPTAFEAVGCAFAYRPTVRSSVPGVWGEWIRNQSMAMHIYFRGGRIAAVSGFVFVSDEFVERALQMPKPWVKSTLVEWHLEGRSPVLLPPDMRKATQGDGLNLFLVCDAFGDMSLDLESLSELDGYYGRTFIPLAGCKLKSKWWEGHGSTRWHLGLDCGMLPGPEWVSGSEELAGCPEAERPYLGYFGKECLAERPGTYVASLFHYRSPIFQFTYEQQVMLAHALEGATDDELAELLSISASAVKKRWQAIYGKVDSYDETLLPAGGSIEKGGLSRGSERRRHLLRFLRNSLEEFSPELIIRMEH